MLKKGDYLVLFAAFLSVMLSLYFWYSGQKDESLFVAIWVPSILACGAYLRLVAQSRQDE